MSVTGLVALSATLTTLKTNIPANTDGPHDETTSLCPLSIQLPRNEHRSTANCYTDREMSERLLAHI